MDQAIVAASRALSTGDPLQALKYVALRNDAAALALRGVAMAQLGEMKKAQTLLRRAQRSFSGDQSLERARCVLAQAEVALATREASWPTRALAAALKTFAAHGEHANALHARVLEVRRLLLLGHLHRADEQVRSLELGGASPMLIARARLAEYEIALRHSRAAAARQALRRAWAAAQRARIPALLGEIQRAALAFTQPAARIIEHGRQRQAGLEQVEALLASPHLVVDACRRVLRQADEQIDLARRPVLFALVRTLAEAWPEDVARARLIEQVFGARRPNASHRARLRVEIGRVRQVAGGLCQVQATTNGFVLVPRSEQVSVLAPPVESESAALLALLSDGEPWSTSALALALGSSQRAVQRELASFVADARVRSSGRGRTQRWLIGSTAPFTTALLLPASS